MVKPSGRGRGGLPTKETPTEMVQKGKKDRGVRKDRGIKEKESKPTAEAKAEVVDPGAGVSGRDDKGASNKRARPQDKREQKAAPVSKVQARRNGNTVREVYPRHFLPDYTLSAGALITKQREDRYCHDDLLDHVRTAWASAVANFFPGGVVLVLVFASLPDVLDLVHALRASGKKILLRLHRCVLPERQDGDKWEEGNVGDYIIVPPLPGQTCEGVCNTFVSWAGSDIVHLNKTMRLDYNTTCWSFNRASIALPVTDLPSAVPNLEARVVVCDVTQGALASINLSARPLYIRVGAGEGSGVPTPPPAVNAQVEQSPEAAPASGGTAPTAPPSPQCEVVATPATSPADVPASGGSAPTAPPSLDSEAVKNLHQGETESDGGEVVVEMRDLSHSPPRRDLEEEDDEDEERKFFPAKDGVMNDHPANEQEIGMVDAIVGETRYVKRYPNRPQTVLNHLMTRITPGDDQNTIYDAVRSVARSLDEPMDGVMKVLEENWKAVRENWEVAGRVSRTLWNPWELVWWQSLGTVNIVPISILTLIWLWALSVPIGIIVALVTLTTLPTLFARGPVRGRHVIWTMIVVSIAALMRLHITEGEVREAIQQRHIPVLQEVGNTLLSVGLTLERAIICALVVLVLYLGASKATRPMLPASSIQQVLMAAPLETILVQASPFFIPVLAIIDVWGDWYWLPLHLLLHTTFYVVPLPLGIALHLFWNWSTTRPAARLTTLAHDLIKPSAVPGLHIEPICTEFLPIKQLRPGAVFIPPPIPPCNSRGCGGYYLAGPRLSMARVFCYRSCCHNMSRAACHRMGGVGKRFVGVEDHERELSDIEDFWRRVDVRVTWWLRNNREDNQSHIKRPPPKRLSVEQWLRRYPKAQRNKMRERWYSTSPSRMKMAYGCFVKKEKTTVVTRHDDFSDPNDHLGCHTFSNDMPDPRGISCPPEAVRVEMGPDCDYYNRLLQNEFNGRVFYAIGVSSTELGEWVDMAMQRWSWAIAVCGDDTLVFEKQRGRIYVQSLDISRFDMHIHRAALETSWEKMRGLGLGRLATLLEKQATPRRYRIRSTAGFGRLKVANTRASGDGDTISSNTLVAAYPAIYACVLGLDAVEVYRKCGFVVTGKRCLWQRGQLNYDFLQRLMLLNDRGETHPCPKPGRILARAFWASNNVAPRRRLEYCRAVVDSIDNDCAHCPLLNDLCARIKQLHPRKATIKLPREAYELNRLRSNRPSKESRQAEWTLADRYGLGVAEIRAMRSRIRAWSPGEFLDDERTADYFRRVAIIDLM